MREELIDVIGQRAAEKLIARWGGRTLWVPVPNRRRMRDARILRLLRKHSYRKVASIVGLSVRQITNIAGKP